MRRIILTISLIFITIILSAQLRSIEIDGGVFYNKMIVEDGHSPKFGFTPNSSILLDFRFNNTLGMKIGINIYQSYLYSESDFSIHSINTISFEVIKEISELFTDVISIPLLMKFEMIKEERLNILIGPTIGLTYHMTRDIESFFNNKTISRMRIDPWRGNPKFIDFGFLCGISSSIYQYKSFVLKASILAQFSSVFIKSASNTNQLGVKANLGIAYRFK